MPDGGVYIAFAIGGAFAMLLWWIASPDTWRSGLIGYIIALAFLVNLNGWRAYRGRHLSGWQLALARLPLRCVGYGTKGGRPIEAAHGASSVQMILFVSLATSAVTILLLSWWLIL
ncbi:MAG: hypothetical protein V3T53_10695 [Phycisphaerales bacterium]